MKKALTLVEMIVALLIFGILMKASISIFQADSVQTTNGKLFRATYRIVEDIIEELTNDPLAYTHGSFDDATFCNYFANNFNIIGARDCSTSSAPDTPNFTSTNGQKWYGFDTGFSAATCLDVSGLHGKCIKLEVDVNGGKSYNTTDTSNDDRDVLMIYCSRKGQIGVPVGIEADFITN